MKNSKIFVDLNSLGVVLEKLNIEENKQINH